jgi:hypothetical protein
MIGPMPGIVARRRETLSDLARVLAGSAGKSD